MQEMLIPQFSKPTFLRARQLQNELHPNLWLLPCWSFPQLCFSLMLGSRPAASLTASDSAPQSRSPPNLACSTKPTDMEK